MRERLILSKNYIDKNSLIETIKEIGNDYRVIEENTYHNSDIDIYKYLSEDDFYLLSFKTIPEEKFLRDKIIVNGVDYFIYLTIFHDYEVQTDANVFIREILSKNNDLYVTDETSKEFYSLDDINSGSVPEWLKE